MYLNIYIMHYPDYLGISHNLQVFGLDLIPILKLYF